MKLFFLHIKIHCRNSSLVNCVGITCRPFMWLGESKPKVSWAPRMAALDHGHPCSHAAMHHNWIRINWIHNWIHWVSGPWHSSWLKTPHVTSVEHTKKFCSLVERRSHCALETIVIPYHTLSYIIIHYHTIYGVLSLCRISVWLFSFHRFGPGGQLWAQSMEHPHRVWKSRPKLSVLKSSRNFHVASKKHRTREVS